MGEVETVDIARRTVDEILDIVEARGTEELYRSGIAERNFIGLPVVVPENGMGWAWEDGYYRKYLHTSLPDGSTLDAVWSISPSPEGNLNHFDEDVLIAIQQLALQEGAMDQQGTLSFSLNELRELMGLHLHGRNIKAIKRSLRKWATTIFISDSAFWSENQKRRISEKISFIEGFRFDDREQGSKKSSRHTIKFGDVIRASIEAGYVCELDLSLLWSLYNPMARALYRFIWYNHDTAGGLHTRLRDVHEAVGMECQTYPSVIKRNLSRSHNALLEYGFLSSVDYPDKQSVLYKLSPAYLEFHRMVKSGIHNAEDARLVSRLAGVKGISRREATALVVEHGHERCVYYLDALPYQENVRNPAAWLKGALREGYELADYQLPPSYRADGVQETLFETREQERERRWEGYEGFFNKDEASAEAPSSHGHEDSGSGSAPIPDSDQRAQEIWEQVLEKVSETINAPSLNTWFKETVPVALKGDVLTLSVPNTFAREYIESRFLGALQGSLSEVLGREGEVVLQERCSEEG